MNNTYPAFKPLTLADQRAIAEHTEQFSPFSDFNFTSLFCWNTDDSTEFSWLHGNLVITMPDYITGEPIHSVLGNTGLDATFDRLLQDVGALSMVPNGMPSNLPLTYTPDPDNYDYVYDLSFLSTLPGSAYKGKRKRLHNFTRDMKRHSVTSRTFTDLADHVEELQIIYNQWASTSLQSPEDITAEQTAFHRLLTHAASFDLHVTEILVDDAVVAFSVNELLPNTFALCHFAKALTQTHEDLYMYLDVVAAEALLALGCAYVNWEQDLGIPGLRQAKQSYKPIYMLEKFTVSRVSGTVAS